MTNKEEIEEIKRQLRYTKKLGEYDRRKIIGHLDECAYRTAFLGYTQCACPEKLKKKLRRDKLILTIWFSFIILVLFFPLFFS